MLHRDLKPGNILVNDDCTVRVADFGLGKLITSEINNDGDLTDFVCTRWFRPPELMMGYCRETYDEKIDCFSVGCILAEILRGRVLFQSASEADQVKLFTQVLGDVPQHLLQKIRSQRMQEFILKCQLSEKVDWDTLFHDVEPGFVELLRGLLEYDPEKRLSAE